MSNLPTPPDPEAIEVLRAWFVEEQLECSLYTGAFEQPESWGILLADLARTVAQGLQEQEGKDLEETLGRIVAAFEEEINAPIDEEEEEEDGEKS